MSTERHADFEAISAYVDGEAPEWADHVAGCAGCRASADEIRSLAASVAAPVTREPATERDAAIAAAVASMSTADGERLAAASAGAPSRPRLAPERPVSPPSRWSRPWAVPAMAAVVIAALGFSGLVLTSYRSSDEVTTVAGAPLNDKAESAVAANAPAVPVGDLGDIVDAATLRSRALGGAPSTARSSSSANSSAVSDASSATNPATGGAVNATTAGAGGSAGAPGAAGALGGSAAAVAPSVVGTRPCEERARSRDSSLREVVYFATARQGPVPAYVLGFATGPAPAPVTLLLLAQNGCAELLRSVGP